MPFQAQRFLEDYQIPWWPPGSKNVGKNYIGIRCPFCDDSSNHGGFNIEESFYTCHHCKSHWLPKVIAALTKTNLHEAGKIIKKYSSGKDVVVKRRKSESVSKIIYPPDTGPLTEKAKQYLISRNFDPGYLAAEWGLLSTGNLGPYKFRILAPIHFKGRLVSYQCRDITGKSNTPYMGCQIEQSVIFLKHTLYGFDKAVIKKRCVVVEGLFDVFRLGPGAVGTFGIGFMSQQVLMLARNFDQIFIMYDSEDQAQEQADKLYYLLVNGFNKKVEILTLPSGDPGELSDDDAKTIMKDIGL
jgi:hypothetical protein